MPGRVQRVAGWLNGGASCEMLLLLRQEQHVGRTKMRRTDLVSSSSSSSSEHINCLPVGMAAASGLIAPAAASSERIQGDASF